MGWRERYQQGAFRGIPFQIDSGEDERAQRLVVHEFPARDKPYLETMGKKANRFTVEAFLVGDNYLEQRDNLQDACTQTGTGKLVHPFYGEITVQCESIRTRHDRTEMRMVRVSMSFVEVGDLVPITTYISTQAKVLESAQGAVAAQKTTFERLFDYASLPYAKAQEVLGQVNAAVEVIGQARKLVGQAPAFAAEIQNIGGALSSLVTDAGELADEMINLITFGFLTEDTDADSVPDVKQSFAEIADLFEYTPYVAIPSEESSAFTALVKGTAMAQGGHMLSLAEFDSVEEAFAMRDQLFAAIDAFQNTEGLDDSIFTSMSGLRAQVERDIKERSASLPRLVEITLPKAVPALVLSYRLYGNVDEENSIISRNRIRHPGIVPSDIPIKVLTDD